jgi:hypothetical protein
MYDKIIIHAFIFVNIISVLIKEFMFIDKLTIKNYNYSKDIIKYLQKNLINNYVI